MMPWILTSPNACSDCTETWDLATSYIPQFEEVTYISFFLSYHFPTVAYFNKRHLEKKKQNWFFGKTSQSIPLCLLFTHGLRIFKTDHCITSWHLLRLLRLVEQHSEKCFHPLVPSSLLPDLLPSCLTGHLLHGWKWGGCTCKSVYHHFTPV